MIICTTCARDGNGILLLANFDDSINLNSTEVLSLDKYLCKRFSGLPDPSERQFDVRNVFVARVAP